MKYRVTVKGITICEFEVFIKKDFLKNLKNVYYLKIILVQHLRTDFGLSDG